MLNDVIFKNRLHILGKMTATLLHEIRNPLSVVKLSLDYLAMHKEELSEDLLDTVENSAQALMRIQALVDNLLFFSRPNVREERICSLAQISDYAVNIIEVDASRKKVLLQRHYAPNLPTIKCDANKLLQIFLNLLTNAVDACSADGLILIKVYLSEDRTLVWEVADDGIGISEEDKATVFTDYFTKKTTGTGLGLSICRSLAQEMNAELTLESELGKGTRFFLIFNANSLVYENEV